MATFRDNNQSEDWVVNPGTGTKVAAIPFTPELIKVEFLDEETVQGMYSIAQDTWDYTLKFIGDPDEMYRLTVNWNVTGRPRRLRYTLATLPDFGGIFGA